jgi:asparagine synthase (glutamine-hydrolysing)
MVNTQPRGRGASRGPSASISEPSVSDWPDQTQLFRSEVTGEIGPDPLRLIDGTPRFSLEKLAINLENPFLEAEFPPPCPWEGVSRHDTMVSPPEPGSSSLDELNDRFRAAVAECVGDAKTVAVMWSGGLDSTSVLVHADALCRRDGRRLIAVVWNLSDQFGVPTGQLAHRQMQALNIRCDLRVMSPGWRTLPEPDWSAAGVRIDYYTRLHRAMIELVSDEGAGVLLTGVGGDEVLAAWQFMTPDLIRARRWRDLRGYVRGFRLAGSPVETLGELAAMVAPAVSRGSAFTLYSAVAYADWLRPRPTSLLRDEYQPVVAAAARDWFRDRHELFVAQRQTPASASVWDSVYPLAFAAHPSGVPLPERSPFLSASFIRYTLGLPEHERFGYDTTVPYYWYKRLHLRLLPEAYRSVAPTYKQNYAHNFREYQMDVLPDGRLLCAELGLIRDVDKRDIALVHSRLPAAVRNVDQWIRGALEMGAEPC